MLNIKVDTKKYPEIVDQLYFDSEGLGFNYDLIIVEWLKVQLGMETEPLTVL